MADIKQGFIFNNCNNKDFSLIIVSVNEAHISVFM